MKVTQRHQRGFTLVEAIVVSAIMVVVFGAVLEGFRYSLSLIGISRAKMSALTVANDSIEYIRSLSYDAVGTVSGIPAGAISQVSTSTLNNIEFTKTTLIEYIDDAADGLGAADSNGITTDYKQAKVTLTWSLKGVPYSLFLVTNIIPRSIETSVGGGTLRVNVFSSDITPLPGAVVRVINTSLVPAIDVTRTTDTTGVALFGGAPAGPNYEISVTAPGYSTDKTYVATTTLPYPTTQPVAVLEADISTMNFFIDELSSLRLQTLSTQGWERVDEPFANMGGVATSSGVSVSGGLLTLSQSAGVYGGSGSVYLAPLTPTPLAQWDSITFDSTLPIQTTALVRVYTGTSTLTLVPDGDLPGNSSGFSDSSIDISLLNPVTYPSLTVGLFLATGNTSVTPSVDQMKVWYLAERDTRPGVNVQVTGSKSIGTMADSSQVYKTSFSTTTDAQGVREVPAIEYDTYTLAATGYDIAEVCPGSPLLVNPGSDIDVELVVVTNTDNTLRVMVETLAREVVRDAEVTLSRPGFSETTTTGGCGQVFFSGLNEALDYTLSISVPGYPSQTFTDVEVAGDEYRAVTF